MFEARGARLFQAVGLTPNAITLLGFAVCVVSAYLVASGWLLWGGVAFLVGSILDLMDGALARLTGRETPFGALLDSVFDRLGEAALFVGLGIYALRADHSDEYRAFFITALLLALIFSQGVSYLRARGEGLGVFTRAGLMTRTERVILLGIGLLLGWIPWLLFGILVLMAAVSCFTLFQRMFTIRNMLDESS
ncbi:MAG: CDP-alcohol phosphatidyltransferase family protein [Chloroflexi bacterium]|nr:CDP-alcohol phosphatidyltransferase family protein [Chloroflexota bacterium]